MGKTSIILAGLLFLAFGVMAQPVPAPATTSQATNLVVQDVYMSPARVGDFWNDVGIPFVLSNGGGTIASNSIAKNNGAGTNLTIYGTLTSTNVDAKIISASNGVLVTASNIFSIKGSAGGVVPAPATTSQATNLVVQDVYMSPARVGDFWYDVVMPYIASNGGGGTATNAIANNNGAGTNLTVYGTLTSTNLNALYDTNNAGIAAALAATNNFGNSVAVIMTNAANQFAGIFTNGIYYGNGAGLTNVTGTGGATNAIANLNGFGTNTTLISLSSPTFSTNLIVTGTLSPDATGTYNQIANYDGEPAFKRTDGVYYVYYLTVASPNYYYLGTNLGGTTIYWINIASTPDGSYIPFGATNTGTATATYSIITNGFVGTNINFSPTNGGTFTGTFTNGVYYGNGGGLTNLNYSNITNTPAIPTTNQFVGTNFVLVSATNIAAALTNQLVIPTTNNLISTATNLAWIAASNGIQTATNGLGSGGISAVTATNIAKVVATNVVNGVTNQFLGTNYFASGLYPVVANGTTNIAHGFAKQPISVQWGLQCLTAEQGYVAGDVVSLDCFSDGTRTPFSWGANSTNVFYGQNSSATMDVVPKGGGVRQNITFSYWKVFCVARP